MDSSASNTTRDFFCFLERGKSYTKTEKLHSHSKEGSLHLLGKPRFYPSSPQAPGPPCPQLNYFSPQSRAAGNWDMQSFTTSFSQLSSVSQPAQSPCQCGGSFQGNAVLAVAWTLNSPESHGRFLKISNPPTVLMCGLAKHLPSAATEVTWGLVGHCGGHSQKTLPKTLPLLRNQ